MAADSIISTSTRSATSLSTVYTPQQIVSVNTISSSISNYTNVVNYLRSRNISFDATKLKPLTKFYPFLQGIDVSNYIIPKLLEITMISGKFIIGETVTSDPTFTAAKISFRLCTPDHKSGPFNNPTDRFKLIPYTQQSPPTNYSETSRFLNIDIRALDLPSSTSFYGEIRPNMRLIGTTSGAVATISNIRLISDKYGRLIGSLFIPDPSITENPVWVAGENTFTLTDSPNLNIAPGLVDAGGIFINQSSGASQYTALGVINTETTNILTTRNTTVYSGFNTKTQTITNTTTTVISCQTDPLAQSFFVNDDTGIFLTSVEVFFQTKPDNLPVMMQLRPMIAGVPSNAVIPFSEVVLDPDKVNISVDGTVPTKFTFKSPIYLAGPQQQNVKQRPNEINTQGEYSIVLLSDSTEYRVFISRMSEVDLVTGTRITRQPTLGSLFKSQNGQTWTPSQYDDLKYKIYRANFNPEGIVRYFNPNLSISNNKLTVTGQNQFRPLSKRVMVGLTSTGYSESEILPGITIIQGNSSGTLSDIAGSIAVGTGVTVSNAGVGYTDGTFNNVSLITETGYGQGAIANVIVTSNQINTVSITSGGIGYQIGDSLSIPGLGSNVGFGGKVVVTNISTKNSLILDDVQGEFVVGISTVSYVNSSGITTTVGIGVTINTLAQDQYYDGLHMKVDHINHGMHSPTNYVEISQMRPLNNEVNSTISTNLSATETTFIELDSVDGFDFFEGKLVNISNPAYVIIGYEVIEFTGISGNTLTGITRGIDNTNSIAYDSGTLIYKYEFNGISLRRINKIHNFAETNINTHPTTIDSYYIKIDTSNIDFNNNTIGVERSNDLYFNRTLQMGESGTVLSNNIQYEIATPSLRTINLAKTNISAQLRTVSGTSISGDEPSFVDKGFEQISLDSPNYFNDPRLICSPVNENRFIDESPGNKSMTLSILMTTDDPRVSPVIDNTSVSMVLTSNLINAPIDLDNPTNYASNVDVRSLTSDKHNTIYISKPVTLKIPANALKVILSAIKTNTNDIRVMYRLFRVDSPNTSNSYQLFPGYSNYTVDGNGIKRVIDPALSDGTCDYFVQEDSNSLLKDYEYSVDDLPDFDAFAIKIIMAGTNQAIPPIIKDLRAIATIKPSI